MSDNVRRFRAIHKALVTYYPGPVKGNFARHLVTLAALITGIVGSRRTNLPEIAAKAPDRAKAESRTKRYSRFLQNESVTYEGFFVPFLQELLAALAQRGPLAIVFDGSALGRDCVVLMASVIYKKRALPLAWIVRRGKKGHFAAEVHLDLFEQVRSVVPDGAEIVFLGDGEFDSTALQGALARAGWHYVCRTAKDALLVPEGPGEEVFPFKEAYPVMGQTWASLPGMLFTAARYGPVHAVVWHESGHREPVYLVTNLELAYEACQWYKQRARIETFFSDQKSRGFHLHKSHLSDPERLARLLIAACLAYLFVVYLGTLAKAEGWDRLIHRRSRCDLSLFQLGLRLLEHMLNEEWPLRVAFTVVFDHTKSVR